MVEYREKVLDLTNHEKLKLIWAPGHQGIEGNEKANDYAVSLSPLEEIMVRNIQTPLVFVANKIDNLTLL